MWRFIRKLFGFCRFGSIRGPWYHDWKLSKDDFGKWNGHRMCQRCGLVQFCHVADMPFEKDGWYDKFDSP